MRPCLPLCTCPPPVCDKTRGGGNWNRLVTGYNMITTLGTPCLDGAGIFYILTFSGFISTFSPQKGESDKIGYSATAKHVFYNLRESSQLLFLMHVLKLSSYTCWSCLSKIVFQACQRFTPATVSNVSSFFVLPVRGVLPELPESCVHHGK